MLNSGAKVQQIEDNTKKNPNNHQDCWDFYGVGDYKSPFSFLP